MTRKPSESPFLTDRWSDEDSLNFGDFSPVLQEILTGSQTPLTVGIFGPWGSGKTSLLRQLRKQIDAPGNPKVRTVWFTAWKYDHMDALWRAFILRVLGGLYPRQSGDGPWEERPRLTELSAEQSKQVEMLERLEESVYRPVDWQELGRLTVDWLALLRESKDAAVELTEEFLPVPGVIKKLLRLAVGYREDEADGVSAGIQREIQHYRMEQLQHMEQFEEAFANAVQEILGKEGRLVVFVDDLDRCLPEKAVEVLEAIKLFLDVPGTVFVLGMDRRVIERGIEARYGAHFRGQGAPSGAEFPISGGEYLQKIVQIPFFLPPLDVADMQGYIEALEGELSPRNQLTEMTRRVLAVGLPPNPRQAKRVINVFRLLKGIAQARVDRKALDPGDVAWPLLAKTVLIQAQYPELYQEWRVRPTLLRTLEEAYERNPVDEDEIIHGRPVGPRGRAGESDLPDGGAVPVREERQGGLLDPYLADRRKYARLERLLTFPPLDEDVGNGGERARFMGLDGPAMSVYVRLAGTVNAVETPALSVIPAADLLTDLASRDSAKARDALDRLTTLEEKMEPAQAAAHRDALRQSLLTILQDDRQYRPTQRAGAGDGLALIGDHRFDADRWYLPKDDDWGFVPVPGGEFIMGIQPQESLDLPDRFGEEEKSYQRETPQLRPELPAFHIARFPVTVAQFRAFVESSGHTPSDKGSLQGISNHPVVWVSPEDAAAYCRWITQQLQSRQDLPSFLQRAKVTLPTERQWERAARHTDGRTFPWGEEPDPNRANWKEIGLGRTSPVGAFPGGLAVCGAQDLSGNIFEWTQTIWRENYEDYLSSLQERLTGQEIKVVRGGSWYTSIFWGRASARDGLVAWDRHQDVGFRVVVVPTSR